MWRHDFLFENAENYRNIPESRIVAFLCSPFEIRDGNDVAETVAMQHLLVRLVKLGLPFRISEQHERLFDLTEVVNFMKYAFHAFQEPTWYKRSIGTMRRLVEEGIQDGQRIAVTVRRRFGASALPPGALVRLNMPKPLNAERSSYTIRWLQLDGAVSDPVDGGNRYFLKVRPSTSSEVEIALRHEFIPGTCLGELDAPLALSPNEGLVKITPRIHSIAKRLGLSSANRWDSMRRIWDFLFDDLSFGFIHYDRLIKDDPLAWCLDHGKVDCRTGSALLVALCRAVAIPARIVTGYTLNPTLPTSHVWAQVCSYCCGSSGCRR